jgi:hypothetical protein
MITNERLPDALGLKWTDNNHKSFPTNVKQGLYWTDTDPQQLQEHSTYQMTSKSVTKFRD